MSRTFVNKETQHTPIITYIHMHSITYTYTYNTHTYIYRSRRLDNDSITHHTSHSPYNTSPTNIHYNITSLTHLGFPTPYSLTTNPNTTQHNTTLPTHTHNTTLTSTPLSRAWIALGLLSFFSLWSHSKSNRKST